MTTEELETLRKALDLTQGEMATRLGIGLRTYTDMAKTAEAVPERYRLAAERVALSIAVERGNPMLAPANVRREALALVDAINYGTGGFQTTVGTAMRSR